MKSNIIVTLVLVAVLILLPVSNALAATSQNVEVTATPGMVSITNSPGTWTINGITGSGVISTNTTYYSNPLAGGDTISPSATVLAGECLFTVNSTSNIPIDLAVNFSDFTGGDTMTNSNAGTSGATAFGAWSYCTGMTSYSDNKTLALTTGSSAMKDGLSANTTLMWGLEILTRTNAWTSTDPMSANVTITATAAD